MNLWTKNVVTLGVVFLCVIILFYHHRHNHYHYYYHLFWGDSSYMLISLGWWNADQRKAWECLWQQHFSDFSWASLPFACGWDWALPARSGAAQPRHIIPLPIFRLCAVPSRVKAKMGEDGKPKRGEDDSLDYFLHFKYNPWILANVSIQSGSEPHVFIFIYAT